MQIQRLQNLWLLIAFVAALVSLNYNWLDIAGSYVTIQNNIPLLILALLATILPLLSLCLYKNLRRQKLAGRLSALFALFTIGYVVALSFLGPNPEAEICILSALPYGAQRHTRLPRSPRNRLRRTPAQVRRQNQMTLCNRSSP